MKKIIISLLILIFLILPICEAKIASSYRHKNDYYAVTFDGEGDAIVSASLQIENTKQDGLITMFTFEIPKHIIIYDVMQEYKGESKRIARDRLFENELQHSTSLSIILLNAVKPGEQFSIILTYKIPKYAEKSLGVYNFDFETIIDNNADLIENVRVAVNVIPDLYMKGSGSEVEYKPDYSVGKMQFSMVEGSSISGERYPRMIEKSKGYIRTSSYLDSGESFHVKGKYAESWFGLNFRTIIRVLVVLGVLIFGVIKLYKRKSKPKNKDIVKKDKIISWIRAGIVGIGSALTIILLSFASKFLLEFLADNLGRDYEFLIVIFFFLMIILNLALLFGPSIYLGIKYRNLLMGILVFIFIVISLILILICFALLTGGDYYVMPFF